MTDTAQAVPDEQRNLRIVHGRGMNNLSETYTLPADRNEMDRLDLQHRVWTLTMGGLFPVQATDIVNEALATTGGVPPVLMDVGTGSGIWAIDMATAFPHAKAIGLDLCMTHRAHYPGNCSFVQGDLTDGLSTHHNTLNLIHARSVAGHLEDPSALMKTACSCLKPGGIFLLGDGNVGMYGPDKKKLEIARDGEDNSKRSWFGRWMVEMVSRQAAKGKVAGEMVAELLQNDDHFELLGHQDFYSPIGWAGDGVADGDEIGEYMKTNLLTFIHSSRPTLLKSMPEDAVAQLMRNVEAELCDPNVHHYSRWDLAWARKR